jgi:hypothetical protein
MAERKNIVVAIALVTIAAILLTAYIQTPVKLEPSIITTDSNSTLQEYPSQVKPNGEVIANFSGIFYMTVYRHFDKISVHISTLARYRIEEVKVSIQRQFSNKLYIEMLPPDKGELQIYQENTHNGLFYVADVQDLGE